METDAGQLVGFTVRAYRQWRDYELGLWVDSGNQRIISSFSFLSFSPLTPPTSSLLDEILLHVVTVNLGAAEDYGLVHFVLFDGPHSVLALQDLNGFRPHF